MMSEILCASTTACLFGGPVSDSISSVRYSKLSPLPMSETNHNP